MPRSHLPDGRAARSDSSARNILRHFGPASPLARRSVAAIVDALRCELPQAMAAMEGWDACLGAAAGRPGGPGGSGCAGSGCAQLARRFGLEDSACRPRELLFAVQTYFALVLDSVVRVATDTGLLTRDLELLGWPAAAGDPLRETVSRLERCVRQHVATDPSGFDGPEDPLGSLYQAIFSKALRHSMGEYYTPAWLVEHVLDEVGYRGQPGLRLLDPTCGSGGFLVGAIRRALAWHSRSAGGRLSHAGRGRVEGIGEAVVSSIVGFDLNPLAVATARARYLLCLARFAAPGAVSALPTYLRDAVLDAGGGEEKFDYVVGNPPWIAWDDLSPAYRQATRSLWEQYGLFSLSGTDARHGGSKKDLAMLMLYVAADRYLRHGGRLGFVMPQTVFLSRGAGDGFRRFRLGPEGTELRVLRVSDLVDLKPFTPAANWTAAMVLEKGLPTVYPVPYVRWLRARGDGSADGAQPRLRQRLYTAQPIDPSRPRSPWLLWPRDLDIPFQQLVGPSDYQAHLGANSAGANGVYWLELLGPSTAGIRVRNCAGRGRGGLKCVETSIEPDLVYPLLRWRDVAPYSATPEHYVLVVQNVQTRRGLDEDLLRRRFPLTWRYLQQFRSLLIRRAAYRRYQQAGPFYAMYNVGPYTTAPVKVVWRRMDRRMTAAVVQQIDHPLLGLRPVVPQETCVLVAAANADEAHYLCAVLNSAVVNLLVRAHSVCGGKGFGTPGILDYIRLRRFDPRDRRHRQLATLSRRAHATTDEPAERGAAQHRIDLVAGQLWNLTERHIRIIRDEVDR